MPAKSIAVDSFMPPETSFGGIPVLPMALDGATCLVNCDDGALLAVLAIQDGEILTAIQTNTLAERCAKLKQLSPWAYLVIIGTLQQHGTDTKCGSSVRKWQWSSVEGALLTVQELGVSVCTVPTEADLGAKVLSLARRDRSTKRASHLRDLDYYTLTEQFLLCLPGIGERLAVEIAAHVGQSPLWALIAMTDGSKLHGIGDKTKAEARQALGLQSDEALGIIPHGYTLQPPATESEKAA